MDDNALKETVIKFIQKIKTALVKRDELPSTYAQLSWVKNIGDEFTKSLKEMGITFKIGAGFQKSVVSIISEEFRNKIYEGSANCKPTENKYTKFENDAKCVKETVLNTIHQEFGVKHKVSC
jgi:hypothetical protein